MARGGGLARRIAFENLDDDPRLILHDQEDAAAPLLVRESRCRLVTAGAASRREGRTDECLPDARRVRIVLPAKRCSCIARL